MPNNSPVRRKKLGNGLTVIVAEQSTAPVVALQAWVNVGSSDESEVEAGIAHVLEHMLFKGTTRRGVGQIPQEIEAAGGDINAWTSFDHTVYHLIVPSSDFDVGLDVLADTLQNSTIDAGELGPELKVILEEIKQREDSPGRLASQALYRTAFARHPYHRPVIGYEKIVKALDRTQVMSFLRRWYVPANVCVVAVGHGDPDATMAKIESAFQGWGGQACERGAPQAPVQRALRVHVEAQKIRESHLVLGFHVPPIMHPDSAALDLLSLILGQGDSSRLNVSVLRQRGLVSEIHAYTSSMRHGGLLAVGAALPDIDVTEAFSATLDELFKLTREVVSDEELSKARSVLESDTVYQKETAQGLANKLAVYETVTSGIEFEAEYFRRIAEATPEQLRDVARRNLRVSSMTVSALVPDGSQLPKGKGRPIRPDVLRKKLVAAARKAELDAAPKAVKRATRKSGDDKLVRVKLDNGATLVVLQDPSVPLVAMRAVWLGGSLFEDSRTLGINHLLSVLVTRGTGKRNAEALAREVEGMAGSLDGSSGRNSFGLRAEFLSRHFDRGLELFADCLLDPSFAVEEIEKEKKLILDDLRAREDDLTGVTFRLFAEALWQRHPYRTDMLGTPVTVKGMTRRRLEGYYQRHFSPPGMTLAVVGDIDPERVITRVQGLLGQVAGEAQRPRAKVVEAAPQGRRVVKNLTKQQSHLVIGFPGTTLKHRDRFALEVMTTVLSGQGGRLFLDLRDKRGLVYRVSAFAMEGLDPGYVAAYISASPNHLAEAEGAIWSHFDRLRTELVAQEDLQRAKRYLVGSHDISLQRRAVLASSLAFNECYGLGAEEYRRYPAAIMAVTAEELRRVARRYLDASRAITAVVCPAEASSRSAGASAVQSKLARGRAARADRG